MTLISSLHNDNKTKKMKRLVFISLFILPIILLLSTRADAAARLVSSWGLDRIDQRTLPLNNTYDRTLTGRGVTFYAVDTGVNSIHSEFSGRLVNGYTRVSDGLGTNDCHGHGTHTAGTVAGTTAGVAPGVIIVPVRVYGCTGTGWTTDLIAGIRWAIEHHQPGIPAVMNVSTSGSLSNSLNWAVRDAVNDGITVVVAAGNNNADACSYSPGSAPEAITVGATDSLDARLSISNYGPCVDIYAPGAWITSSWIPAENSYRSLKGTSFAAPHVTGIAALILEAHPEYTPAQVADYITSTATSGVIAGLSATSRNLLAYAPTEADLTPPAATTTTTVAPTTTTTIPAPATTTTIVAPSTTTTVAPSTTTLPPPPATVSARKVGSGYYEIRVEGTQPNSTFAVRALNSSRRPARSISWLVTSDSSGAARFFIRVELSGYTFSIVK
jgi:subtilisin family serine protease